MAHGHTCEKNFPFVFRNTLTLLPCNQKTEKSIDFSYLEKPKNDYQVKCLY